MDKILRQRLLALSAAAIADADKSIRVMDSGIRRYGGAGLMLGPARTVRCHEDFLTVIEALDQAEAGEVLVVDTQQSERAVVGELFSLEAARRKLAGIIVDGPIRDLNTIRELEMPVYARSSCPCSGTTQHLSDVQCQVRCGAVSVHPGEIMMGDDDGILVASADHFARLVAPAEAIEQAEAEIQRRLARGDNLIELTNFREHAAARRRGEASALSFRLDES